MEKQLFKTSYQTFEIVLPVGFDSNKSVKKQLEVDYDFCDGVALVERSNPNAESVDISILDRTETYIEPVPKQLLETSSAVGANMRFFDTSIGIVNGYETEVKINANNALTAEVKLAVVFRIRKPIDTYEEVER